MTTLTQKTILVTGAAGGFGQQFIRQLLARDNYLILTDLNAETLTTVAQSLYQEVGRGEIVACISSDLSTQAGADALFAQVQALGRPIDMLINNAGIGLLGRHDEVPQEDWERLMQVNLMAPMRLCSLFIPQMIERRQGHIVNIASLASWTASRGLTAYAASKFGLRGFSEMLAEDVAEYDVLVSAIHPFFSRTPIISSPRYGSLAEREGVGNIPEDRMTDPADVIAEALQGIEKGTLHIFPDATSRFIYRLKRYVPALFHIMHRRLT